MMKRIDNSHLSGKKLLSKQDLQEYLSVGNTMAAKIGKESGALRKIGKRALYDRETIDAYIDGLGA